MITDVANITVVLLAAGRGIRMSPLTEKLPKPLLKVGDHSLIEHHLMRLKQQGFEKIVINLDYLGEQIHNCLGDGGQYGLCITYSDESDTGALETAGGLRHALPLIEGDRFIVANADIWTDYPFSNLADQPHDLAHLVMVDNPTHNQKGDFCFAAKAHSNEIGGLLVPSNSAQTSYTFSGIAAYHKRLFQHLNPRKSGFSTSISSINCCA